MAVGALVGAALVGVLVWPVWPWWRRLVDVSVEGSLPAALAPTVRLSGYAGLWQLVLVGAVVGAVLARGRGRRR